MQTDRARDVIIWGAAGHAKVLAECLAYGSDRIVALFDNNAAVPSPLKGVPCYTGMAGLERWQQTGPTGRVHFLIAIGGDKGRDRVALHRTLERAGMTALSVVHPTAFVAGNATIGAGCHILAGARVCVECRVGMESIINTQASVDHECTLGAGVHVAPGAILTGCVRVGDFTMIGAGAVILPRVTIGANAVIGAGAVVTRDIPDNAIAYGNPARVVRRKDT
jgi:sugar O-acyltransferase (sialic acid O-acetyltransferase NeuD family)